jgi:hypothetical protein
MKIKFSLAVAVAVVGLSLSGLAQQNGTFKVKKSPPEKAPRSIPMGKTNGAASSSGSSSKDLQNLEHQTAKSSAPPRAAANKTSSASTIKPVKDKPNPPINFGETGGGKRVGMVNQGSNSYKGRLKQKHAQPQ